MVEFDAEFAAELAEEIEFLFHFFDNNRILRDIAALILVEHFLCQSPLLLLLKKLIHSLRYQFVSLANCHINELALPRQVIFSLYDGVHEEVLILQIVFDFGEENIVEDVVVNSSPVLIPICFRYQIFQKASIFLKSGPKSLNSFHFFLPIALVFSILGSPKSKPNGLLLLLLPFQLHLLLHFLREKLLGFFVYFLGNPLGFATPCLDLRIIINISGAFLIIVISRIKLLLILQNMALFRNLSICIALKS